MYCVYLCLVNIRINQWYVLLHPRSSTLSSWQRQIRSSCGLAGNRGSARADTSENAPSSKITGQISTNQGAHIIQRWRKMKGPDWTLKTICIAMMWIVNWVLELWSSLVNAARFIRHTLPARVHEGLQEAWATNMYMLFQSRLAYWQFSSHLDNFNSWMDCFRNTMVF